MAARATLRAAAGVKRAAGGTAIVHRAGKPIRDERADEQNHDEHGDAQKRVFQL